LQVLGDKLIILANSLTFSNLGIPFGISSYDPSLLIDGVYISLARCWGRPLLAGGGGLTSPKMPKGMWELLQMKANKGDENKS
jgi:hypothetical protein